MKYLIVLLLLTIASPLYSQDDPAEEEYETTETEESSDYEDQMIEPPEYDESMLIPPPVDPAELSQTKTYREEQIYHKNFDEAKWREIVGDTDFKQNRPDPPKFNFPNMPWGGMVLKAIGYTIIVAIVLVILYLVFKNINYNPKAKSASVPAYSSHDDDDIEAMDLPALLKKAMSEKNFKLAIRYYYLSLLKNLHEAGMIKWEKDKTNRDYLSELFTKEKYYDDVRKLTRSYEEVWYGDHAFRDESLLSVIASFETVQAKLNQPKTQ